MTAMVDLAFNLRCYAQRLWLISTLTMAKKMYVLLLYIVFSSPHFKLKC